MKKIQSITASVLLLFAMISMNSCATIMHGTKQSIGIASNPIDASVWVDRVFTGKTPLITKMSRNNNHFVKIELDGYEPYEVAFTKQVSGWVFGNIIFGGVIGLAVDAISGGLYRLTPEQVQTELRAHQTAYFKKSTDSCIVVVLQPDPSWEKIGNLIATNP